MSTQPSDTYPSGESPSEPASSESLPPRDVTPQQANFTRLNRRREKIVAEIERNRRGEYTVPTWVLGIVLLLIIAGYAALIIFG